MATTPIWTLSPGRPNKNQRVDSANFTYPTSTGPQPVAQPLKTGVTGAAYSVTISVVGGTPPVTFALTLGSLPTSLSLNPSTGVISGTPSVAATSTFTITATDSLAQTGSQQFQIIIQTPPIAALTWVG